MQVPNGDNQAAATGDHQDLLAGLKLTPKALPCSYLYDQQGSELYDKIVTLPEYYPYKTELHMLQEHMPSIIQNISPGSVVVELGCGSATKTRIIIDALLDRDGPEGCFYEGVDCSPDFLQLARQNLMEACPRLCPDNVGTICALYMDGLEEARRRHPGKVLCVLWLGSSVGNLDPQEAGAFFKDVLRIGGPSTQVLLCTDMWKDAGTLHAAYHDSQGVTEQFIKNGMSHAMSQLGVHLPDQAADWTYDVVVNPTLQQVEMWLVAPDDLRIPNTDITIAAGERVLLEVSRKFTQPRLRAMAFSSGWCWQAVWANAKYSIQMLYAPELALKNIWADTDALFATMPDWSNQPITIRHPFCFYYAHVAAFAKLKILPQDPADRWDEMFSRGIDPDVLDPSKCHNHPDAPPEWPTKDEIVCYALKVREVLKVAIRAGTFSMRGLCLALEHERMHQETLAYMQAQQRRLSFEQQLPPPSKGTPVGNAGPAGIDGSQTANGATAGIKGAAKGVSASSNGHEMANGSAAGKEERATNGVAANGNGMSNGKHGHSALGNGYSHSNGSYEQSANGNGVHENGNGEKGATENGRVKSVKSSILKCAAGEVVLGVSTDEQASGFVWDNEGPQQKPVHVEAFAASTFPVTVGEYRSFALDQRGYDRPELWQPQDFKHFKQAGQRHPATWTVKNGDVWVHSNAATHHWREVVDQPVWVSLAEAQAFCAASNARLMTEPEYLRLLAQNGLASKGPGWRMLRSGGWEWTSSEFAPLPGFQAMRDYPEYSVDFFDGKHGVLKGSAPVTHPSLIRDSFRNFYQGQYPFMFAKFRCCRDA